MKGRSSICVVAPPAKRGSISCNRKIMGRNDNEKAHRERGSIARSHGAQCYACFFKLGEVSFEKFMPIVRIVIGLVIGCSFSISNSA